MRIPVLALLLIQALTAFSQTAPGQPDALRSYRRGRDMEAQNRTSEAASYYEEAVKICLDEISRDAANMDSYTVLTWALQRQGRYAEVLEWGDRGLRVNERDFRIIETMGEAYFYLGDHTRALRYMQRYVDAGGQRDRLSVAYFFIGEIYRLDGKFRHADISYTTAVRLEPGLFLWWYRLGAVREAVGDFRPAIQAYEQALRLNPGYQPASDGLRRCEARLPAPAAE